jgi:Inositol 1,3,4-trisphosphate 5/6-kinase pre-ATP-grasp domain
MKLIGDLTGVRGGEMEENGIEEAIVVGSAVAGPDEKKVVFGGSDVAEENWIIPGSGVAGQSEKRVVVGFALTKKKVKSFMQPKFMSLAR